MEGNVDDIKLSRVTITKMILTEEAMIDRMTVTVDGVTAMTMKDTVEAVTAIGMRATVEGGTMIEMRATVEGVTVIVMKATVEAVTVIVIQATVGEVTMIVMKDMGAVMTVMSAGTRMITANNNKEVTAGKNTRKSRR